MSLPFSEKSETMVSNAVHYGSYGPKGLPSGKAIFNRKAKRTRPDCHVCNLSDENQKFGIKHMPTKIVKLSIAVRFHHTREAPTRHATDCLLRELARAASMS